MVKEVAGPCGRRVVKPRGHVGEEAAKCVPVGNGEADMRREGRVGREFGGVTLVEGGTSVRGLGDGFKEAYGVDPSWVGDVFDFSEPKYFAEMPNSSKKTVVIQNGVGDVGEGGREKEVCVGVSPR